MARDIICTIEAWKVHILSLALDTKYTWSCIDTSGLLCNGYRTILQSGFTCAWDRVYVYDTHIQSFKLWASKSRINGERYDEQCIED